MYYNLQPECGNCFQSCPDVKEALRAANDDELDCARLVSSALLKFSMEQDLHEATVQCDGKNADDECQINITQPFVSVMID